MSERIDLLQGTLDMLVLQTLQWGPQHGYGITQAIRTQSSEALQIETGSLYPALHRLERQGWVKAEWDITDTNQRAKFYRLTPAGRKQLLRERDRWEQLVAAIGSAPAQATLRADSATASLAPCRGSSRPKRPWPSTDIASAREVPLTRTTPHPNPGSTMVLVRTMWSYCR